MTEKKVEEVKPKEKYVLKEVITQTYVAVGVEGTEQVFNDKGILVEILNKLERIERAVL